jgi:hypothetical protein
MYGPEVVLWIIVLVLNLRKGGKYSCGCNTTSL